MILPFLSKLAENNNREWFEANKKDYKKALDAFTVLVQACLEEVDRSVAPMNGVPAKDCIFRIFRDVRFSADKSPYKKNMAAIVGPNGRKSHDHGIYLNVMPGENQIIFGVYEPEGDVLKAIRQEIDYSFDEFQRLMSEPKFKAFWGDVKGDSLKTMPKGYEATNPAAQYLKMKDFYFIHKLQDSDLTPEKLPKILAEGYKLSEPVFDYLRRAYKK